MTPSRLDEIQARVDAATPGPWQDDPESSTILAENGGAVLFPYITGRAYSEEGLSSNLEISKDDLDFILAARTDIPDLLAEVRRLTAELAATKMQRPLELSGDAAQSFMLAAECSELKQKLSDEKQKTTMLKSDIANNEMNLKGLSERLAADVVPVVRCGKDRLTKLGANGIYGLLKVKDNEQEVDSPYKNTLAAIVECFQRLAEYENAEFGMDGGEHHAD